MTHCDELDGAIDRLRQKIRDWPHSLYKLQKKTGIDQSTLKSLRDGIGQVQMPTLRKLAIEFDRIDSGEQRAPWDV